MLEPEASRVAWLASAAISVATGTAVTALVVWLFAIPLAGAEMLARFPEGWRVIDLIANAFAVLFWGGLIRVTHKAVLETWGGRAKE
jgi:hypothetical protein